MATELLKDLGSMSEEEQKAMLDRMCTDPDYWQTFDAHIAAGERVRQAVEAGDRDAFTRDELVEALNYAEATRWLTNVVVTLGAQNLDAAKRSLTSAVCTWCQWKYRDESFDWPADRVVSEEDLAAVNERVGAQLREHIKVCPNHPMRALEAELAAARSAHASCLGGA